MLAASHEIPGLIQSGRPFIARNPDGAGSGICPFIVRYKQWDRVYAIDRRGKLREFGEQMPKQAGAQDSASE